MNDPSNPHEKGRTLPIGGAPSSAGRPASGAPIGQTGPSIPPYVPAQPPGVPVQLPGGRRAAPSSDPPGHGVQAQAQAGHGGPGNPVPPAPQRLTRSDELLNTGGKTVFEFDGRHADDPHRPPGQRTFAPGSFEIHPDDQLGRGETNLRSGNSTWWLVGVASVVVGATWMIAALRPDPPPPEPPAAVQAGADPQPAQAPPPAPTDPKADAEAGEEDEAKAGDAKEDDKATQAKAKEDETSKKPEPKAEEKPKAKAKPKPKRTRKKPRRKKKKVIVKPKKPPREPENDFGGLPKPPS